MFVHERRTPHLYKNDTRPVCDEQLLLRIVSADPRSLWEMKYIETHVPELHNLLCQVRFFLARNSRIELMVFVDA